MGLPPSVDDWIRLFFEGKRRYRQSERVLRVLYGALSAEGDQEFEIREIANRADVGVATVDRVLRRMRELGLLETASGVFDARVAQRGLPSPGHRLRYHPHWPPGS